MDENASNNGSNFIEPDDPTPPIQPSVPSSAPRINPLESVKTRFKFFMFRFGRGKFIAAFIVAGFASLLLITSALAVYTDVNIPFVNESMRKTLMVVFYKIPFLPKTPEQILIAAVEKNTRLTTYAPDFSMSANIGAASTSILSVDLHAAGPVDFTHEDNVKFDLNGELSVRFPMMIAEPINISGKIRKIDGMTYLKVDKFPDAILNYLAQTTARGGPVGDQSGLKSRLDALLMNWISYDTKGLSTEARKNLDKEANKSIADEVRKSMQEFLLNSSVLPEVKREKDEKIDGVSTFHLSVKPSKKLIKKLLTDYVRKQNKGLLDTSGGMNYSQAISDITDDIETLKIDVWFGSSDAILRKNNITFTMKLTSLQKMMTGGYYVYPPENSNQMPTPNPTRSTVQAMIQDPSSNPFGAGDLGSATLSFSSVLFLKDIGKPVNIAVPSPLINSNDFTKGLQDVFLSPVDTAQPMPSSYPLPPVTAPNQAAPFTGDL